MVAPRGGGPKGYSAQELRYPKGQPCSHVAIRRQRRKSMLLRGLGHPREPLATRRKQVRPLPALQEHHPEPNSPRSTHQTQGTGEEAWEGSQEDREEETEAAGAPGEGQAGGWTEARQALVGTGVTLMAALTPP